MITADRVSIGLNVGTAPPLGRINFMIRAGRLAGYDAFWTVDHFLGWFPQSIWDRDFSPLADPEGSPHVYFDWQTLLGHVASRAGRTQVGVGVTESVRRHPVLLAQAAMTLSHVAKEPPILGIGAGEAENTIPYGLDFSRPVSRLEDALQVIRTCFTSRGPFDHDGTHYQLDQAILDLNSPPGRTPQIWLAAHGPRMLELTGRYADGWLPTLPYTPESYQAAIGRIRAAAAAEGRNADRIVPGWSTFTVLGKTEADARRLLESPVVRFMALLAPDHVWQAHGLTHPLGEGFGGLVDFMPQNYDRREMMDAMRRVPVDLVAETVVWGTPETVLGRLSDFVDVGLRHLVMNPASAMASKRDALFSLRSMVSVQRELRSLGATRD